MTDQLDDIFTTLGTGYWNWLHYIAIGYAVSLPSPHALAGAFVAPRLKFECRSPADNNATIFFSNDTDSKGSCSFFSESQNGTLNEEICTEWDFDNSTFKETLTSEFGLVCEKDYLRATYQSMYMIGVLVGSPLNGILADRFGRRLTFVCACILFSIMTNLSFLLPNLPSVFTFRFLVGTMHTSLLKTGYILAMEITNPKVRSLVGITLFLPWALGTMAWGGLAYLERRWRYLVMSASLPSLVLIPVLWFMDESPRWLVVKGKYDQALEVLKKAAKWNQVELSSDEDLLKLMMENEASREGPKVNEGISGESWKNILKNYVSSVIVLFRTPRLRVASIVMHLNYLVLGMVYFGLSLSGGNFHFNMFSYMALMGLVEVPAYTVMAPIVSQFGRRMPVSVSYLMSGVVLLLQPFLPSGHQWLIISSAMLGKMAISMSFQGNNLYASELFPTEVRTRGVSSSFMMSRVGSSVSPFITEYLATQCLVAGCNATLQDPCGHDVCRGHAPCAVLLKDSLVWHHENCFVCYDLAEQSVKDAALSTLKIWVGGFGRNVGKAKPYILSQDMAALIFPAGKSAGYIDPEVAAPLIKSIQDSVMEQQEAELPDLGLEGESLEVVEDLPITLGTHLPMGTFCSFWNCSSHCRICDISTVGNIIIGIA